MQGLYAAEGTSVQQSETADQTVNRLVANTNSDWLTKIIVGLGLIHLKSIPTYLNALANTLTQGLGATYGSGPHSFSIALIVYFGIVGFLGGYPLTRLYIYPLIGNADGRIAGYSEGRLGITDIQVPVEFKRIVSEEELKDVLVKPAVGPRESATTDDSTALAYRKVSAVKEEKITDPVSLAAWATAQLNLGNNLKALEGFKRAIQTFTNDAKLRYEYALALHRVGYTIKHRRNWKRPYSSAQITSAEKLYQYAIKQSIGTY